MDLYFMGIPRAVKRSFIVTLWYQNRIYLIWFLSDNSDTVRCTLYCWIFCITIHCDTSAGRIRAYRNFVSMERSKHKRFIWLRLSD